MFADIFFVAQDSPKQRPILLVDDDARTSRILVRLLEEDGFCVVFVGDGATALAQLKQGLEPELLITEMQMPGIDGMAVAHYARQLYPQLPIILLTGYPELVGRQAKTLSPSPRVFTKPVNYDALTAELARQREPDERTR